MPAYAITADHLSKTFGEGEARTIAVNDISMNVELGQMLYIVGPWAVARPPCSA